MTVWSDSVGVFATATRFATADQLLPDVYHFSGLKWRDELRRFVTALDENQLASCHAVPRCKKGTFQPWMSVPLSQMVKRLESDWFPSLLEKKAFTAVLQPIWSLGGGKVYGYEALCRAKWGGSVLNGGALLTAARVHGLLGPFDAAARRSGIVQGAHFLEPDEILFINILPSMVDSPERDFASTWAAVTTCQLDPARIVFEFVESEAMPSIEKLAKIVGHIRSRGANIALDDFGAGHASLTMMDELRPDIVKFDRALIPHEGCEVKSGLVTGLVNYAHALGIQTVAEGIETMEQLAFAEACGFDHVQGWLIGRPSEVPCRPDSIRRQ